MQVKIFMSLRWRNKTVQEYMQHIFLQITRILYIYTVKVFDFKLKGELRFNILSFHESIDHLHK